ncbi:glycoside hydrolase [Neocallimastix lanati (nom. inval.)]|jgi:endo-1,4-beta-xylanase|uniref:Beta-xylanase n=1 Tax=Neocallimastix californiae TaxID=1754190 RepID=A0A1Y2C841_9FUNG|nr:glycoside hydrolase [Neocallimastix sp. JGI-2020a]KAG4103144.1 glycoside hydrolase [Neocallimastix sp. JGI-2020a]ORY43203.1 glycoside hydrolase [Neocallimastix californiae]|eukprot:ORY43203.1 glycoside hydrolase [Neocallimastix californiae]
MKFNQLLLLTSSLALSFAKPSGESCWSEKFNIPCCKSTTSVERSTYNGDFGKENGQWCGLGESKRPIEDVPPEAPIPRDIDSLRDPAAECDISDSITGDSLAKEAPFRFGVGLNGVDINNYTPSSKKMMELIKYQFNSMTYSNGMKSIKIMDEEGSRKNIAEGREEVAVDFSGIIDGLEFAKKNGIHIRGHVLVWHKQTPDWFFRKDFDTEKEYADVETIFVRLESYMKAFFDFLNFNYPGVVDVFDVVNEAIEVREGKFDNSTGWYTRTESLEGDDNIWNTLVGPSYVVRAFRIARKYALPTTKLVYNDVDTFMTKPHDKTQAVIDLMNILRAEDLVDALGMESYIDQDLVNVDAPEDYARAIERFTEAGLEIQITEFTIYNDDREDWLETQTKRYRDFFQVVIDHVKKGYDNISSFTVFGLQDGYRFYDNDTQKTRLFDHDLQKKPNYYAIMEILKQYNAELAGEEVSDDDNVVEVESGVVEEEENSDSEEETQ